MDAWATPEDDEEVERKPSFGGGHLHDLFLAMFFVGVVLGPCVIATRAIGTKSE